MNRKTAGFIGLGFLVFLLVAGCEESTLENDTDGGSESIFTIFRTEHGLAGNSVTDIAVDYIFDGVWFATRNGISFYSNEDSTVYTYGVEYTGIPDMKVTSITIDNTGTVWAGTETGVGFLALGDSLWTALAEMNSRHVTDVVVMSDFSIWFGTRNGVNVRSSQGLWTSYTAELGPSSDVTSIARSGTGDIWVGTSNGISVFDGTRWTSYGSSVLPSTYVNAIYTDRSGKTWCGTSSIAVAYDGNSWISYGPADGLTASGINDFAQDSSGTVWAATDGGIFYFSGNKWTMLSLPDEVAGAPVTTIAADNINGTLWIGTVSGAVMYRATAEK